MRERGREREIMGLRSFLLLSFSLSFTIISSIILSSTTPSFPVKEGQTLGRRWWWRKIRRRKLFFWGECCLARGHLSLFLESLVFSISSALGSMDLEIETGMDVGAVGPGFIPPNFQLPFMPAVHHLFNQSCVRSEGGCSSYPFFFSGIWSISLELCLCITLILFCGLFYIFVWLLGLVDIFQDYWEDCILV